MQILSPLKGPRSLGGVKNPNALRIHAFRKDILSIAAMSAEPERVFSGTTYDILGQGKTWW
jgi:hypothetical protein